MNKLITLTRDGKTIKVLERQMAHDVQLSAGKKFKHGGGKMWTVVTVEDSPAPKVCDQFTPGDRFVKSCLNCGEPIDAHDFPDEDEELPADQVEAIDQQTNNFVQARMMGRPVSFRYVDGTHETFNA